MNLTLQQIFDKGVTGVLAQGQASIVAKICRYRGINGSKCAIGQLIKDEAYSSDFEGCRIAELAVQDRGHKAHSKFIAAMLAAGIDCKDQKVLNLLIEMQADHDAVAYSLDSKFMISYKRNCQSTANRFGLSTAVLDAVKVS